MKIGIIGGGQLGMMMAIEAKKCGHNVLGLDPNPKCPLSFEADKMIVGDYSDKAKFRKIVTESDVVTYEFENVDLALIKLYEDKIPQKTTALQKSRNRLVEKNYAKSLGIETPKFELFTSNYLYKYPIVIKTITGGYDGKGQHFISNQDSFDQLQIDWSMEYIVEELIEFDFEISVIATRDAKGTIVTYPIPINKHKNGILFSSTVGCGITSEVSKKAIDYTKVLINDLNYVGTLAVEYFVKGKDVVFNEFAPRPHNSGHYTIEGCSTSQFENHIRAITGHYVRIPRMIRPSMMINVLGQNMEFLNKTNKENIYLHMYHKEKVMENRKMGHITIMGYTVESLNLMKKEIVEE